DVGPRLLQRAPRDLGVVSGSQMARRLRTDDEALLAGHVRDRELVRFEESRDDRSSKTLRISRIALLNRRQIAAEQRLQRAEDISAAAAEAENEDGHIRLLFTDVVSTGTARRPTDLRRAAAAARRGDVSMDARCGRRRTRRSACDRRGWGTDDRVPGRAECRAAAGAIPSAAARGWDARSRRRSPAAVRSP